MRVLIEIAIIAGVISLGWHKPFKEHYDYANRTITWAVSGVQSKLQKHHNASAKPN